jgi:RHS repeat-associated protein
MRRILAALLVLVALVPATLQAAPATYASSDAATDLARSYFGARYYASRTGRMTTVDPLLDVEAALVDPQQCNRYAYARKNPLVFIDPSGAAIELVGDADQRQQGLDAICSAVGGFALSYLYENAITKDGTTRYFVGIRTNGPNGNGPGFGTINSVANMFAYLIADTRIAQLAFVAQGANVHGQVLGTHPDRNPATTNAGTNQVFMLDRRSAPLGSLGASLMERGGSSPLDAGLVSAHEFGHLYYAWRSPWQTIMNRNSNNDEALRMENAVRLLRNPNAILRRYHDDPRLIGM